MARFISAVILFFSLAAQALGQCPGSSQPYLYTMTRFGIRHLSECIDQTTGKLIYLDAPSTPGVGTVTSVSIAGLSPLFSASVATATSTPAISFALASVTGPAWFGRAASGPGAPAYQTGALPFDISGKAATATALATTPTQCTSGEFVTGIAASGNANCATPAGNAPVWSSLQSPAADLTLDMLTYNTSFLWHAAGSLTLGSAVAASSLANQSSPAFGLHANYWGGDSHSHSDLWTIQQVHDSGTNPETRLHFGYGGTNAHTVELPQARFTETLPTDGVTALCVNSGGDVATGCGTTPVVPGPAFYTGNTNPNGSQVPTLVQGKTASGTSLAFDSSVTSGHLIVVAVDDSQYVMGVESASCTDTLSSGLTKVVDSGTAGGVVPLAIFKGSPASSGSDTVSCTWTGSGTFSHISIAEFANVQTTPAASAGNIYTTDSFAVSASGGAPNALVYVAVGGGDNPCVVSSMVPGSMISGLNGQKAEYQAYDVMPIGPSLSLTVNSNAWCPYGGYAYITFPASVSGPFSGGVEGDHYLDTTTNYLYTKNSGGSWDFYLDFASQIATRPATVTIKDVLVNSADAAWFTVGGTDTLYDLDAEASCHAANTGGAVNFTISWTGIDGSSTSQTFTPATAADCTTLGAASRVGGTVQFQAKHGTNVGYAVTTTSSSRFDFRATATKLTAQ